MFYKELPSCPNFIDIETQLSYERKAIIERNNLFKDETCVRSLDDALIILNSLDEIVTPLYEIFKEHHSLIDFFDKEYSSFNLLIAGESILDLIFLDDCLISEKEMFFFGQDGGINHEILKIHKDSILSFIQTKERLHLETQEIIKLKQLENKKVSNLDCKCYKCSKVLIASI